MTDDEIIVSDKEIEAVEKEIASKDGAKEEQIKAKVRQEMEQERKLKELETQKTELEKKLEAEKKANEEAKEEQKKMFDEIVEKRIAEEMAHRKAVVTPPKTESVKDKFTPERLDEIERNSYEAFMKERLRQ